MPSLRSSIVPEVIKSISNLSTVDEETSCTADLDEEVHWTARVSPFKLKTSPFWQTATMFPTADVCVAAEVVMYFTGEFRKVFDSVVEVVLPSLWTRSLNRVSLCEAESFVAMKVYLETSLLPVRRMRIECGGQVKDS